MDSFVGAGNLAEPQAATSNACDFQRLRPDAGNCLLSELRIDTIAVSVRCRDACNRLYATNNRMHVSMLLTRQLTFFDSSNSITVPPLSIWNAYHVIRSVI